MTRHDFDPDLDRIGVALRAGAAQDLARREPLEHQRVNARRGALVATAVLAVVAIGVFVLTRPVSDESALARQTLQRVAAVLAPKGSSNAILYISATETLSPIARRDRLTTVSTLNERAWIQQGPPWGERTIEQVPGGPLLELNNGRQIYNETDNVIYPAPKVPAGAPRYTLTPTGTDSYRLRVKLPHRGVDTQTLDAMTAHALRAGTEAVQWTVGWNPNTQTQTVRPLVLPTLGQLKQTQVQQPDPASTGFAAELHGLLNSGHARVTRTTISGGQPAIEISSVHPQSGPRTNYYVNPQTYAPIELDTFGYDSPNDVTRVRINAYQTLPLANHKHLLKVTIRAGVRRDHAPAGYWNAFDLPTAF